MGPMESNETPGSRGNTPEGRQARRTLATRCCAFSLETRSGRGRARPVVPGGPCVLASGDDRRQFTLYRSTGLMTLFALYGVGFAAMRTYHSPDEENVNVLWASPAPSMTTSRLAARTQEPLTWW